MKVSVIRKTNLLLLLLLSLLFSCQEDRRSVNLLVQAQSILENKPAEALILLDSIRNPENMGKDNYMQFVVARTEAKLKTNKDVTRDTLIFEAQKYFNQKNNAGNAALANFYAGGVYRDKGIFDKAMMSFLEAENYAKRSSNDLLAGKSMHNIGFLYFVRDIADSSIVSYQSALSYYNKSEDTELLKLEIINAIGRAYKVVGKLDSAYAYFDKGLGIASKINNQPLEAMLTYNLGAVLRQQKEYNKAKEYFDKALILTTSTGDSLKIYLNLSKLYNAKIQLDSAKLYSDLIKGRLPEINDNYTLESAYGALVDYNNESGNLDEALYYNDLRKEVSEKITAINNSERLLDIEKEYQLLLKQREMDSLRLRSYLYISVFASIIILIVLVGWFRNRGVRLKHAEEREKNKVLEQKIECLLFLQSIYQNLITDWADIEKEVKALAAEFGVEEMPPLYIRIRRMVDDIRDKANGQLIESAKDLLKKEPFGEAAIDLLEDRELLILMLSYCRYCKAETALILNLIQGDEIVQVLKSDIERKLRSVGMAEERINEILFPQKQE